MRTLTKLLSTAAVALAASAAISTAANAAIYIGNWTTQSSGAMTVLFGDSGIGTASDAAPVVSIDPGPGSNTGLTNGIYQHTVSGSGNNLTFTDVFDFVFPAGFLGGDGTTHHSSLSGNAHVNLVFTGVTFNGAPGSNTNYTFHFDDTAIANGGPQRLVITGTGGPDATYGGTLTFTPVPEPAAWSLMILGFGGIGAAIRNRRRTAAFA